MAETGQTYFRVAMNHAIRHRQHFLDTPQPKDIEQQFKDEAEASLQKQRDIEASDTQTFDEFLADYYRQYDFQL